MYRTQPNISINICKQETSFLLYWSSNKYVIVLNFRDFRGFAQIRENKFPRNFSKQADYNEHDANVFDLL